MRAEADKFFQPTQGGVATAEASPLRRLVQREPAIGKDCIRKMRPPLDGYEYGVDSRTEIPKGTSLADHQAHLTLGTRVIISHR